MKHITKLGLTLFASVVLVACGGGGSGSSSNAGTNPNPINSATGGYPIGDGNTGAAYVTSYQDEAAKTSYKILNDSSDLNFIVVDGQKIQISNPNITSGSWTSIKTKDNVTDVCCGTYKNFRFGVSASTTPNGSDYIFYNGTPSKSIPTSGNAKYAGQFIITAASIDSEEDYLRGTASFDVNFDAKTVNGRLTGASSLAPISVGAKIAGNSFTGKASSTDFATQATVEGKFFGENAKELGGVFSDAVGKWAGAFGAAKQ